MERWTSRVVALGAQGNDGKSDGASDNPLGVEPVSRIVQDQDGGSPRRAAAMPSRWPVRSRIRNSPAWPMQRQRASAAQQRVHT